MTDAMKWVTLAVISVLALVMIIFVLVSSSAPLVSSSAPSVPNPIQQRMSAYTDCLNHTQMFWGGHTKEALETCKEMSGQ